MISLFILATLFGASQAQTQISANLTSNSIFEFDRNILQIDELDYFKPIRLRLKEAPNAKVIVHYEASSLTFQQCGFEFTKENYNVYQELKVFPVPEFKDDKKDKKLAIKVKSTCEDTKFHDKVVEVPVAYKVGTAGTCTAVGDPHIKTFDDVKYDTFEYGPYYLIKSPALTVQVYQDKCGGKWKNFRGCIKAVAVRYGASTVILDIRNDKKATPYQVTPNTDGIIIKKNSDKAFDIKFGQSVVGLVYALDPDYINVNINLAAGYRNKISGLCNAFGNGQKGFLKGSDGKLYDPKNEKTVKSFTQSWKVLLSDNLFYGIVKKNPPPIPRCPLTCSIPKEPAAPIVYPPEPKELPKYVPPPPEKPSPSSPSPSPSVSISASPSVSVSVSISIYASPSPSPSPSISISASPSISVSPSPSPFVKVIKEPVPVIKYVPQYIPIPIKPQHAVYVEPISPPVYVPPPIRPASFLQECEKTCTTLLNFTACSNIIDASFYVDVCKADALQSGNFFRAESVRQTFLKSCETKTSYMAKDAETVQDAYEIRKDVGLGENMKCPKDCSGNGDCTPLGCVCRNSFAGDDCSLNLKERVQYNEEKHEYSTDVPIPEEVTDKDNYVSENPNTPAKEEPEKSEKVDFGNAASQQYSLTFLFLVIPCIFAFNLL